MNYKFKTEPYQHQYEIWEKSWRAKYYALFLEMGTGKSKIAIDTMGALYQAGEGAFEFERTASRLMEMQSRTYIETPPSTIAATDFIPFALTTDLI